MACLSQSRGSWTAMEADQKGWPQNRLRISSFQAFLPRDTARGVRGGLLQRPPGAARPDAQRGVLGPTGTQYPALRAWATAYSLIRFCFSATLRVNLR